MEQELNCSHHLMRQTIGINTVSLTSVGNGLQTFSTVERKKVASSIIISNPGSGYKNPRENNCCCWNQYIIE